MNRLYNSNIRPIKDNILVAEMNFGNRVSAGGVLIMSDDGRDEGIRPRWGRVYAVGPDQKDVQVGQWVLVTHGRWGRGIELIQGDEKLTIRRVEPESVLGYQDSRPVDA